VTLSVLQAEQQLRKLHQEISSNEDLMLQLQHELSEERQRAERQAAASGGAATAAASPAVMALLQQHLAAGLQQQANPLQAVRLAPGSAGLVKSL